VIDRETSYLFVPIYLQCFLRIELSCLAMIWIISSYVTVIQCTCWFSYHILTRLIRYIYYWNLQLLSNVIIIKTKVLSASFWTFQFNMQKWSIVKLHIFALPSFCKHRSQLKHHQTQAKFDFTWLLLTLNLRLSSCIYMCGSSIYYLLQL
jgi:hypothetical protein